MTVPVDIHNEEEVESYTDGSRKPSHSEVEAIELLTLLVGRYEETHYPIPPADAVSVVGSS
jgi:HTH-type transcriptional regulator/antitoxin HigA